MGDRKARLAALAAKAGRVKMQDELATGGDNDKQNEATEAEPQSVSFRNYAPSDPKLDDDKQGVGENDEHATKRQRLESEAPPTSSSALHDALKVAKEEVATEVAQGRSKRGTEEGITAPKKINWDLKRDIEEKLGRIEKRTQKAIVAMLKQRLENEAADQTSDESDLD